MATVEETIRDFEARGMITADRAERALAVYKYEMDRHGDDAEARRVLAELFRRTPEEHRQKAAEARAIVMDGIIKALERQRRPVSTPIRFLQALIGGLVGAVGAVLAVYVALVIVTLLIQAVFGAPTGRVRSMGKAGLALLIAPVAGGIVGALYGWSFDRRIVAVKLRRALSNASMLDRACIAWAVVWTMIAFVGIGFIDFVSRSSFYWWKVEDYVRALMIWLGPIVGGWVISKLVRWVMRGAR